MKTCILMMAVPGAGKSTLCKELGLTYDAIICSADYYFYDEELNYIFDPKKLGEAHQECQDMFYDAVSNGNNVIVDNTNVQFKNIKWYIEVALEYGYKVIIQEPKTDWKYDVKVCSEKNTHNVPFEKIQSMLSSLKQTKKDISKYCEVEGLTSEIDSTNCTITIVKKD